MGSQSCMSANWERNHILLCILQNDKFVVPEEKLSFSKLFDATRIAHNFKLVFKKSLGKKRLLVLLLLIAYVLMYFVYEGENVFSTYYIINSLLGSLYATDQHWTALQVVKNIALIFSTLLCCVILSKCLKIRDVSIGIFASICNIIGVIFYFLVGQTWQLYVATMLNVCHGVILFTSVSFLSKFYDGKEFGRLFGVLNIFFCLALISKWAYATVFVKTIDSFPTAVYLSSLFLNIAVLVLYCISFMFWWLMSDSEVFEES
ncbi:uncharacterized protein LOC135838956 isoform X2 [Planococcus citri]|uniref:uncharacterized protein LOC135838956 isoform X2 n=1 Tax=Planococcus citri TaxID=170843 RepID=UPI0031F8EEEC